MLIRNIIITLIIFCYYNVFAQSNADIEYEIINYTPTQKIGVSDNDYKRAVNILKQTLNAVDNKVENFNVADYWNTSIALVLLKEESVKIEKLFFKGVELDRNRMCVYTKLSKKNRLKLYKNNPERFKDFMDKCIENNEYLNTFQGNDTIQKKTNLVKVFNTIYDNDQKYRKNGVIFFKQNFKEQRRLDSINLKLIDSLFQEHKEYIGRSKVGKKNESTMWAVVQHSNLTKMKEYLPTIYKAVNENELSSVPLKLLIDRIHHLEFGYQIFGSQGNIPLASEEIRINVAKKYHLKIEK